MFTPPPFDDVISKFTLRFKDPALEQNYQNSADQRYHVRFSMFYVILASMFLMVCVSFPVGLVYLSEGRRNKGWSYLVCDFCIIGGIVLEILVNCVPRLRTLRTIPFTVLAFVGCGYVNSTTMNGVSLRPGYVLPFSYHERRTVGSMMVALIDCFAYSVNWMSGTGVILVGIVTWISFTLERSAGSTEPAFLAVTLANFALGMWVGPALMYWNERQARHGAYLHWCGRQELKLWKELLNHLPVGVLIYRRSELSFASIAAKRLLLGDREGHLQDVKALIESNVQLKAAMGAAPPSSDTQKSHTSSDEIQSAGQMEFCDDRGCTKTLEVSGVLLGLQSGSYRLSIIEDQTTHTELHKERLDKQYMKEFFAMIAHELRNPLHGVLGIFESLKEGLPPRESECVGGQCQMGINTVRLMMGLVNDILDLSQLESGNFRLVNVEADVKEMIDECVELMQHKFRAKGVQLIQRVNGITPTLKCDKNRYKQIVLNLLGNAFKFTEHGTVSISASYNYVDDLLLTTVKDTGVGVKDEDRGRLFTLFGKLEGTSLMSPQSAGLGLHICKKLSEAMGGSIRMDSVYMVGTTITFTIKNKASQAKVQQSSPEQVILHITDDNDTMGNLIRGGSDSDVSSIPAEREPSPRAKEKDVTLSPFGHTYLTSSGCASFPLPHRHSKSWKPPTAALTSEARVLVVDDEPICAMAIQFYLSACGVQCEVATSGKQAVDMLIGRIKGNSGAYRLIFMDINMPLKNGIEATHEIRKILGETEQPFVVGMTGDAEFAGDDDRRKQAGMDKMRKSETLHGVVIVIKPVERTVVASLVAGFRKSGLLPA